MGVIIVDNFDGLFEQGIEQEINKKEPNLYKVADWIKKCRSYSDNHKAENLDPEKEATIIQNFYNAWKEHYSNNPDFYNSELYRDAIRINGKENDKVLVYIEDIAVDFSQYFHLSLITDFHHNIVDKFKKNQITNYNDYLDLINSLNKFDPDNKSIFEEIYKRIHGKSEIPTTEGLTLRKTIVDIIRYSKTNFDYNCYVNVPKLKIENLEKINRIKDRFIRKEEKSKAARKALQPIISELQEYVKTNDYKGLYDYLESVLVYKEGTFEENFSEKPIDEMDLLEILNKYNITKDTWLPYKKEKQKNTEKKFFYNLGISLSLDYETLESFMQIHGFSVSRSWDEKDIFYRQFIKIGLGIQYINTLFRSMDKGIKKENYYSLKKKFNNRNNYLTYIHHYEKGTLIMGIKRYPEGKMVTEDQYVEALLAVIDKLKKTLSPIRKKYTTKTERIDADITKLEAIEEKLDAWKEEKKQIENDPTKSSKKAALKDKIVKAESKLKGYVKNEDGSMKTAKEVLEDERSILNNWVLKLDYREILWDFKISDEISIPNRSLMEWEKYQNELEQKLNDILGDK